MKDDYISRSMARVVLPHVALEELERIPAADVAPVRHGRWVKIRSGDKLDGSFSCACCGKDFDIADGEITPIDVGFFYCPNCGARMEN